MPPSRRLLNQEWIVSKIHHPCNNESLGSGVSVGPTNSVDSKGADPSDGNGNVHCSLSLSLLVLILGVGVDVGLIFVLNGLREDSETTRPGSQLRKYGKSY